MCGFSRTLHRPRAPETEGMHHPADPVPEADASDDDLTVVVADDHGVVRGGLRLLLHHEIGIHVIGEAERRSRRGAARARRGAPTSSCSTSTCRARRASRRSRSCARRWPDTQVVVLTMQDDPAYARAAMQAGAAGYVSRRPPSGSSSRPSAPSHGPRRTSTPSSARGSPRTPAEPERPDDLTDREVEVLRLIALGHTNGEIAEQLYLSVRTVESHRAHIQQKLGRTTRAELVRYALERGLVAS